MNMSMVGDIARPEFLRIGEWRMEELRCIDHDDFDRVRIVRAGIFVDVVRTYDPRHVFLSKVQYHSIESLILNRFEFISRLPGRPVTIMSEFKEVTWPAVFFEKRLPSSLFAQN